ncbi:ABC transporter ATP-binding protein, partial [Kiloniella laminariae]
MTELLKVRGLKIEGLIDDSWTPIVHGVDLDLARGEVLGLIGESGAGKSTIGLASMGYCRAGCRIPSGSVIFDGQELVGAPEEIKRKIRGSRIAYVAQSAAASFNPAHRLKEQFAEGPAQHGIGTRKESLEYARYLFDRLNLPDPGSFGNRFPHQVSGGQLQRAMVAMAMSTHPDLIVFDEPTTALDVTTQIEVLASIKDVIREEGMAALYITHDLAVVAQMSDRIMVLRYGNEVETGTAEQILEAPVQPYTQELVAARKPHAKANQRAEIDPHPILEVRNVTASYGGMIKVLKNVNISVGHGKTVAVVGESGSGKSTTARAITGLLPPLEGEILYKGEALPAKLKDRSKDQLRKLQMIYQLPDVAMNPRQTIGEIIGRPLSFYFNMGLSERNTRVKELLQLIDLPEDYITRYPQELSGGQKQRVCIARALAAEPELVICDEVTSALDPLVAEEILALLDRLQRELGVAYLFITHDLATVENIADEVVVMQLGEVKDSGAKVDMFKPPHHPYTDLLLSSKPEMRTDWLDELLAARARGDAVSGKDLGIEH